MTDLTGNRKKRPPFCPITRGMADAGMTKLDTLTGIEDGAGVTDLQLVSEIFQAMWAVYWEQVFALQGKNLKIPNNLILPPSGLVRQ